MISVVLVGGDAALWLAALALHRALAPAGVKISVVELPTALAPSDVYSTLPAIEALHARIGIDEAALLRATGGAFSLGTKMVGPNCPPFLLPWGSHGAPVDGTPFFPAWLRARAQGLDAQLQDFSLSAVAAGNGRLMLGDETTVGFARTDYAYTLPARAYVGFLKGLATRDGIPFQQARSVAVERVGEAIAVLTLDTGECIDGDLFVDASGPAAVLAAADDEFDDWSDRFPARWRLTARAPALRGVPPYLEQRAMPSGWVRLQPTPDATWIVAAGNGTLDASVLAEVEETARMPLTAVAIKPLAPRRRVAAWRGNCVALSGAFATLDPALGVSMHAAQLSIVHLLALFPAGPDASAERAEYNRLMVSHLNRIADAQRALYALAPWPGHFWDRARALPLNPTLVHTIDTFRARGQIAPLEDETFDEAFWQALFIGLGTVPESWLPSADQLAPEAIKTAFRGMFGFIRQTVLAQPMHDAYLANLTGGPGQ